MRQLKSYSLLLLVIFSWFAALYNLSGGVHFVLLPPSRISLLGLCCPLTVHAPEIYVSGTEMAMSRGNNSAVGL